MAEPNEIQLVISDGSLDGASANRNPRLSHLAGAALAAAFVSLGPWMLSGPQPDVDDSDAAPVRPPTAEPPSVLVHQPDVFLPARLDAVIVSQGIPQELLAAELYHALPSAPTLRNLFEAVGGFDGLSTVAVDGSFDLVRFDPTDDHRLRASVRSSYGAALNEAANEMWHVGETSIVQQTWAPGIEHDFAHYNTDGSITMWANHSGLDFEHRVATVFDSHMNALFSAEPRSRPG